MKNLIRLFLLQLIILGCNSLQAQWVYTGGPGGGNVSCFAFSHDGSGGTTIFVGTDRGVYRSTDNGANWQSANSGLSAYARVTRLLVVPSATGGACLFAVIYGDGVFRSTDHGTSWTSANNGFPVTDVRYSNSHFRVFVTDVASVRAEFGETILLAGNDWGKGVYRSTDLGDSWSIDTVGLPRNADVRSFAVCPDAAGDMTILTNTWNGVYRSTDAGLTWKASSSDSFPRYFYTFATIDTDIFIGTEYGVYLSTDCGLNWTKKSDGLPVSSNPAGHTFVRNVAAVPDGAGGTNLFAGIGGNIFISTDMGEGWSSLNSDLPHDNVVASMGVCDSLFFVGIYQRGLFLSKDGGDTWGQVDKGLPNTYVTSLTAAGISQDSTLLFVGTWDAGILCSNDEGATWYPVNNGQLDTLITCLTAGLNQDGGVDLYAATGTRGVFHSSDNGESWNVMNPDWLYGTIFINAVAVAYVGAESSQIYVATGLGMYRSTRSGSSWTMVNNGLPVHHRNGDLSDYYSLTSLSAARNAADTDFVFVGTEDGVYRTTDHGSSWDRASDGLTDTEVKALAAFSLDGQGSYLFAATPSGLFVSTDYGVQWGLADSSWSSTPISSIVTSGTDVFVLAGGGGIWKRPASQLIVTAVHHESSRLPENFSLYQNYPNPFNPTTTISYELSAVSHVTLTVYDVLGREVATLVNEEKSPGTYGVKFDRSGLSSGVYFYKIRAGAYTAVKKMFLLK